MDESATLAVGRQLTGGSILETFDNGSLSGAVVSHDQCQWGVELDGLSDGRAEGADARDGELVDLRHAERLPHRGSGKGEVGNEGREYLLGPKELIL